MVSWPDVYLQHFTRFFGKPFDVESYRQDDGSALRLATFDQVRPGRIYASLGLSEHAAALKDLGEVILAADDKGKDIPFLFVNALCFILQKRIPLGSHFAIGGVESLKPDFAEYFHKHALYFSFLLQSLKPGLEKIERDDTGLVFQALFISWEEQDYLKRNGWENFEELLRAQGGNLFSLQRPSCV
jgi:hypothetical protein